LTSPTNRAEVLSRMYVTQQTKTVVKNVHRLAAMTNTGSQNRQKPTYCDYKATKEAFINHRVSEYMVCSSGRVGFQIETADITSHNGCQY